MSATERVTVTLYFEADTGCWYVAGSPAGPAGLVDLPLTDNVQLAVDAAEPERLVELVVALPGFDPNGTLPPETLALVSALLGEELAAQLALPMAERKAKVQVNCRRTAALRAVSRLALLEELRALADAPSPWWAAEAAMLANRVGTPELVAYARHEARQAAPALAALAWIPGDWWQGLSEAAVDRLRQLTYSIRELLVPSGPGSEQRDLEELHHAIAVLAERLQSQRSHAAGKDVPVDARFWAQIRASEQVTVAQLLDAPVLLPRNWTEGEATQGNSALRVRLQAFREQIAPETYGRFVPDASLEVSWAASGPVQVTAPLQPDARPEELEGLLFRVFDAETGTLLGAAELQVEARSSTETEDVPEASAVARVVLPRSFTVQGQNRVPDRLEVDLTSQPRIPPVPGHRRRRRMALQAGFLAAQAGRLGRRKAAEKCWHECARLWRELGEHSQGLRAEALAAAAAAMPADVAVRATTATWLAGECLPAMLDAWAREQLAAAQAIRASDRPAAMQLARLVLIVLASSSPREPQGDARLLLAELLAEQGGNLAARSQLRLAQEHYGRLGHARGLNDCRRLLAQLGSDETALGERRSNIEGSSAEFAEATVRYAIGVTLLRDEQIGVLIDREGRVLDAQRRPIRSMTAALVASEIAALTRELVKAAVIELDRDAATRIVGLGVDLGGHVDGEAGEVVFYNPRRDASDDEDSSLKRYLWKNVPFAELLEKSTGFRCVVENDANALAVFELHSGNTTARSFAVLLMRDGIGCGLVLKGELYRGARGAAGEIGHIVVPGGRRCTTCGRHGCLDSVASVHAILVIIGKLKGQAPIADLDIAIQLLREQDKHAMQTFEHAGDALAHATADVLNLLNPSRVILHAPDVMLESNDLVGVFQGWSRVLGFSTTPRDCEFVFQPMRCADGAQGAAVLALQRFADSP